VWNYLLEIRLLSERKTSKIKLKIAIRPVSIELDEFLLIMKTRNLSSEREHVHKFEKVENTLVRPAHFLQKSN